ncbi:MAG TPA: Mur ligase family protein [Anaerolineales bacterium]|nr:Mur ligase family protein [Anaerolineales bacterium]
MRYFLTALLFFLWLPTTLQGLLYHTYLWQLKEYRLDRMLDFVRSNRRMVIRNTLGWLAWSVLTLFFPLMGMIGLAGLAASTLRQLGQHQLRRPVFTGKAILTLAGSGGLIAIILTLSVIPFQLWRVLLPVGSEILTREMRTLTIAFTLLRVLVPGFVSLAVGMIYLPSEIQKRRIIQQATAQVAAVKPKNIIGITGSYGKTSTKTFLTTILSAKYPTFATAGGTNINIAIAQQILREFKPNHKQMVIEMAAYTTGEITNICRTTPPNIGIWLAVNEQHLSLFGGIEGTVNAKYELIAALPPNGLAILNGDDSRVMAKCAEWPGRKIIFSLQDPNADYYAADIKVEPEMLHFTLHVSRFSDSTIRRRSDSQTSKSAHQQIYEPQISNQPLPITNYQLPITPFSVPLAGRHNLSNLLAAIAAAHEVGMSLPEIAEAAKHIQSLPGTLAPRKGCKGTTLIDSCYSSNPTGVRAALDYLSIFEGKKKIILFPGIIELGDESDRIHRELGAEIANVCDLLILIKDDFAAPIMEGIANQIEILRNLDDGEILQRLDQLAGRDTVILFEGRGTGRFLEGMK